jgi:hypothetical protein
MTDVCNLRMEQWQNVYSFSSRDRSGSSVWQRSTIDRQGSNLSSCGNPQLRSHRGLQGLLMVTCLLPMEEALGPKAFFLPLAQRNIY